MDEILFFLLLVSGTFFVFWLGNVINAFWRHSDEETLWNEICRSEAMLQDLKRAAEKLEASRARSGKSDLTITDDWLNERRN